MILSTIFPELRLVSWSVYSLDQEKAFDRVDRSFLPKLLDHLGFGPSFCQWIATSYGGAFMRILLLMVTFQIELICVQVFGRVTLCHPCFTSSVSKS